MAKATTRARLAALESEAAKAGDDPAKVAAVFAEMIRRGVEEGRL